MTEGQEQAIEQLREIVAASNGTVAIRTSPFETAKGDAALELSLECRGFEARPGGLRLRPRERVYIFIPAAFPFAVPQVLTPHKRFAGHPHVQWSQSLCLYRSKDTEWSPQDGMYGFMQRLEDWYRAGARNELDAEGAPLHPPVTYRAKDTPLIVPRADTPPIDEERGRLLGLAVLEQVRDKRIDITGWALLADPPKGLSAPVILLEKSLPWEFPTTIGELLDELQKAGVERESVLALLKIAALDNPADTPMRMVIGTPMRGVRGESRVQHLVAWELDTECSEVVRRLAGLNAKSEEDVQERVAIEKRFLDAVADREVRWCPILEARQEALQRRDAGAPMSWFSGKHVAVWGCGALGGHVALMLARAGIRKITLCDNGVVASGLLVRQPYNDRDIGYSKAAAIAVKLEMICPDLDVEVDTANLISGALSSGDWTKEADVVVDATASRLVQGRAELARREDCGHRVPVVSMVIDAKAERGKLTVAPAGFSGGSSDLTRKAKIVLSRDPTGEGFRRAFWPDEEPSLLQPEPGCSDPTFRGSAADSMALAGAMLNCAAMELGRESDEGAVHLMAAPHVQARDGAAAQPRVLRWEPDQTLLDEVSGYEVRLTASAWRSMSGWIADGARCCGKTAETGGVLFGERDDASRVLWVDDATGPPPDSTRSPEEFICGVEGVQEANAAKDEESGGSVRFVGMWHTHPDSEAFPSPRDVRGMKRILTESELSPKKALLLIVGGTGSDEVPEHLGASVFEREAFQNMIGEVGSTLVDVPGVARGSSASIGLALSGGGARAMAFHLGCLRALHDLGVLEDIRAISAVSGGSVLAALYAYSDGNFAEFELGVRRILRQGLQGRILRESLKPWNVLKSLGMLAGPGLIAALTGLTRGALTHGLGLVGLRDQGTSGWVDRLEPPFARSWSRTSAFEAVLERYLFPHLNLTSPRRSDLDVVFNATDLRTLSAMRFGSCESGCWRYGRVADNGSIPVAHAVACSAAFPFMLPAVDREYRFEKHGQVADQRVILTDGGVYDNLGVTCLEPGRDPDISYNVFPVDQIIACDAGAGLPSGRNRPFWWPSRMRRSFDSTYRQVQRGAQQRLHDHAAHGRLAGFIYAYLGTRERKLPYVPGDWVPRQNVMEYPTDFAPMSEKMIDRLSARGDRLIRLLFEHYAPQI